MALLDLCARRGGPDGRPPDVLYTGEIAERVAVIYWPQMMLPFLYDIDWEPRDSISLARLPRAGPAGLPVRLRPGAGEQLVRLAPLIRPLVELHWTQMVATINHVATEEQELHRHLFGRDRPAPPKALREGLASLQAGRCFYCHTPFHRTPEADHFIPRVRCGIDTVENLVLADRSCNNDKRDLLPATPLVDAWAGRNREHKAPWPVSPMPAAGTPTRRAPWRSPARSTATSRRALRRLARHPAGGHNPRPSRHCRRDHLSSRPQNQGRWRETG